MNYAARCYIIHKYGGQLLKARAESKGWQNPEAALHN